jgi:hypothetical protein
MKMKEKRVLWGMLAPALMFGFVLAGCGSSPKAAVQEQASAPDLTGTWVSSSMFGVAEVIFNDAYSGNLYLYGDAGESAGESSFNYSWKDGTLTLADGEKLSAKLEGDIFTIADLVDEPLVFLKVSKTNILEGEWKHASDDGSYQILLFNTNGSASWTRYAADGTENGSGTFTYKPFSQVANMKVDLPELGGWGSVQSEISFPLFKDDFNKLVFKNAVTGPAEMVFERQ